MPFQRCEGRAGFVPICGVSIAPISRACCRSARRRTRGFLYAGWRMPLWKRQGSHRRSGFAMSHRCQIFSSSRSPHARKTERSGSDTPSERFPSTRPMETRMSHQGHVNSHWNTNKPSDEDIFLVDALGLTYRSCHALTNGKMSFCDSLGTRAVYGFTSTIPSLLKNYTVGAPVIVVIEGEGRGSQDIRSLPYQLNLKSSKGLPSGVRTALPWVRKICLALRLPVMTVQVLGAEETTGTIAKEAGDAGMTRVTVSSDNNFWPLLAVGKDEILKPTNDGSFEAVTEQAFRRDFRGWHPRQYVDVLSLVGDTANNPRGVPGLGIRTVLRLISPPGDFETLLEVFRCCLDHFCAKSSSEGRTDTFGAQEVLLQISRRLLKSLRGNEQRALHLKRLVTIRQDLPQNVTWPNIRRRPVSRESVGEILHAFDINFETFFFCMVLSTDNVRHPKTSRHRLTNSFAIVRGPTAAITDGTRPSASRSMTTLHAARSPGNPRPPPIGRWLDTRNGDIQQVISACTEWMNLIPVFERSGGHDIAGFAISALSGISAYIDLEDPIPDCVSHTLEDQHVEKRGWFLKELYKNLSRRGFGLRGLLFDIHVAVQLLHADEKMSDKRLLSLYAGPGELAEWLAGPTHRIAGITTPKEALLLSAVTVTLSERLKGTLDSSGLLHMATLVEFPLIRVLGDMEMTGVPFETDLLGSTLSRLRKRVSELESAMRSLARPSLGQEPFRPSSRTQMARLLTKWGLQLTQIKPKSGYSPTVSLNKRVLSDAASDGVVSEDGRRFANMLLQHRGATNVLSKYTSLRKHIHCDGRIRATFYQESSSGRVTCRNPNLQSMPCQEPYGYQLRQMVRATDGKQILSADYSQIELRILASMCGDHSLLKAFARGEDVHKSVAAKIFGVPLTEVSPEQRKRAKQVNYGIVYGVTPLGLARQLRISRREAENIISDFYREFPAVQLLIERLVTEAKSRGYARTLLGRRLPLPLLLRGGSEEKSVARRVAVNMPIQGTQADMIKLAMARIHERLLRAKSKSKLILQVHDELVLEVVSSELTAVKELLQEEMTAAFPLPQVDLIISIRAGQSW